ncbi:MAG TPA: YfbK domain-containing protein [Alphaproteobacteria bacterium]|jgi:hypothetical protein|nr:YfbK domain-containing protein [Alphaproteobacteria bacterium]
MQSKLGLVAGIALAIALGGGCDDRDKQGADKDKPKAAATMAPARYGAGWHAVAETRQSGWSFNRTPPPGRMLASQSSEPEVLPGDSGPDALSGIRAALMANMLPAHGSVHIEALVNRALSSIGPLPAETVPDKPMVVLATTPWNEESLLLWVEVPGLTAPDSASVGIEFDPSAVAAFRALGDPAAMPNPADPLSGVPAGRAAMLYELLPQRTDASPKGNTAKLIVKYGVLHVAGTASKQPKLDEPITTTDAVGTIDNAPEIVRFAAAAAGFGGLLRGDPAMRDLSCNDVIALAQSVRQPDADGWRAQLIALMYRAQPLIDLPPAR